MSNRSIPPWWTLDNAAKIFPSTGSAHDSKVFRFVCELREPVEPQLLQRALDRTVERFPIYRSVMKRGWFWYYLEDSPLPAQVRREELPPCCPIYPSVRRSLLFRVLYYRRRISLEVYHALTDGTGALNFLCALVYEYLLLRCPEELPQPVPVLPYDASPAQQQADSFQKYYEKPKGRSMGRSPAAYQIRRERLPRNHLAILEGRMPLDQVLACARARGVTLTELMTAIFLRAIHAGMRVRDRKKPVVITIPVNLRSYFPSESARNFFATINAGYDFSRGGGQPGGGSEGGQAQFPGKPDSGENEGAYERPVRAGAQRPSPPGPPPAEGRGSAHCEQDRRPGCDSLLFQRREGLHAQGDGEVDSPFQRFCLCGDAAGLRLLLWRRVRCQLRQPLPRV